MSLIQVIFSSEIEGGGTKWVATSILKVCFSLESSEVCLIGLEGILRNGEYVGHIRRGDTAYYLDKEIAYGYITHPQ